MVRREFAGEDPSKSFKSEREVFFDLDFATTKVYEVEKLETGNLVVGPSIIEGIQTTFVVPSQYSVKADEFLNMVLAYQG